MSIHLWPSRTRLEPAPLNIVAPSANREQRMRIMNSLSKFAIALHSETPADGNYVLAVAGKNSVPAGTPQGVPVVDLFAPDLEARLREAALYVLAQNEIRK